MVKEYPDHEDLISLAFDASRIIKGDFYDDMKVSWKTDHTPVTGSDLAINELVVAKFERDFPHITVIGEEGRRDVPDSEYWAILDPLDGTVPFTCGVSTSTFCLAVMKGDQPVSAVIRDPFCDRTWYASAGKGCFINKHPIHLRCMPLSFDKATVSLMWWPSSLGHLHEVCPELVRRNARWLNLGAVAICGGLIASGKLSASIFPSSKAWETAAMQLIVQEAGGVATDLHGQPISYGRDLKIEGHIMAADSMIHGQLVSIVKHVNGTSW